MCFYGVNLLHCTTTRYNTSLQGSSLVALSPRGILERAAAPVSALRVFCTRSGSKTSSGIGSSHITPGFCHQPSPCRPRVNKRLATFTHTRLRCAVDSVQSTIVKSILVVVSVVCRPACPPGSSHGRARLPHSRCPCNSTKH